MSGYLLEEYRDSVHPIRGKRRADWWYVTQVAGLVWRNAWVWALLFGGGGTIGGFAGAVMKRISAA